MRIWRTMEDDVVKTTSHKEGEDEMENKRK